MEYIDTKDQASMIRAALKKSFPGTKFSVRISRYSGGSSVNVSWTDGPTDSAVAAVANTFDGRRFDGMTDSAYSAEHYLTAEGESIWARDLGGPFASDQAGAQPKPEGARVVRFAGCVMVQRNLSKAFEAELLRELAEAANVAVDELRAAPCSFRLPLTIDEGRILRMGDETRNHADVLLYRLAAVRVAQ